MNIHREGAFTLMASAIFLGIINFSLIYFLPEQELLQNIVLVSSILVYFFLLNFFRTPDVVITANPNEVIAPASGKVVVIEETIESEYFNAPRRQVSIFMSPIDVHVNRNPIAGLVKYVKYHAGKYLVAWHPKASTENERTSIVIQHESGAEILMRQIAGALARRICFYVKENQKVFQGTEFGFIKFGSRVDLYLPLDAQIVVQLNQRTECGKTVIAKLK